MERLDLRLVEYFVAVAEELHFSRAAERLRIAQPSLSQQIRRLEDQLGVTLLERTSRHVALTPAGETLLLEGKRTLAQAARAIETTRATAAERVAVGFYGSAGSALLADVLREFSKRHPSVSVTVRELLLGSIDDILAGKVDVAFTRLLPGQANLEIAILAHESRLVVLPVSHPLARRKSLTFAELREERFITNPVVHTDGAPSRWLAEQRRHGLPGRVAAQAASIQEILALVATGRGVSLVPSSVARHYRRADISYVAVTDADPAVVSLAWRPEPVRATIKAFIQTASQVASRTRPLRAAPGACPDS
jgi:DNA-binding transcriptional LysR family regulator